jgi:hypothetical protein
MSMRNRALVMYPVALATATAVMLTSGAAGWGTTTAYAVLAGVGLLVGLVTTAWLLSPEHVTARGTSPADDQPAEGAPSGLRRLAKEGRELVERRRLARLEKYLAASAEGAKWTAWEPSLLQSVKYLKRRNAFPPGRAAIYSRSLETILKEATAAQHISILDAPSSYRQLSVLLDLGRFTLSEELGAMPSMMVVRERPSAGGRYEIVYAKGTQAEGKAVDTILSHQPPDSGLFQVPFNVHGQQYSYSLLIRANRALSANDKLFTRTLTSVYALTASSLAHIARQGGADVDFPPPVAHDG